MNCMWNWKWTYVLAVHIGTATMFIIILRVLIAFKHYISRGFFGIDTKLMQLITKQKDNLEIDNMKYRRSIFDIEIALINYIVAKPHAKYRVLWKIIMIEALVFLITYFLAKRILGDIHLCLWKAYKGSTFDRNTTVIGIKKLGQYNWLKWGWWQYERYTCTCYDVIGNIHANMGPVLLISIV